MSITFKNKEQNLILDKNVFSTWLYDKTTGAHHRQFLLIDLAEKDILPLLNTVSAYFGDTSIMSEELCVKNTFTIPLSRYQNYLGQQTNALIFDARRGFSLNALYAGAGMISHNGILAILLPPLENTVANTDGIAYSYGLPSTNHLFRRIFVKLALRNNAAFISDETYILPASRSLAKDESEIAFKAIENDRIKYHFSLSNDQTQIYQQILATIDSAYQDSKTISVILGSRGRGKSSLLGYLATAIAEKIALNASLSSSGFHNFPQEVVVTSLNKKQLLSFYATVEQYNSHSIDTTNSCINSAVNSIANKKIPTHRLTIRFCAPDEIKDRAHHNSVVLIDEVASLAPMLVKHICEHFTHCIITGTTTGYEGSANGFTQRLLPFLNNSYNTTTYKLTQPFRWLQNDPIENCLQVLLGKAQHSGSVSALRLAKHQKHDDEDASKAAYMFLDRKALLENDELYQQVFNLLSQAHYQTTPNDILRTLDAVNCEVAIAYTTKCVKSVKHIKVIGVVILFEEGGLFESTLNKDISLGKRRVQGHLTAQALSLYLLSPDPCQHCYLRINRIAILDKYKRNGIASSLITFCERYARIIGCDYVSVSFGYNQSLHQFWSKNAFILVKYGHNIDAASGTASLLMLKCLQQEEKLDWSYINFRLFAEQQFISLTNKKLTAIYSKLFDEINHKQHVIESGTSSKLESIFTLYLKHEITLQKILPLLVYYIEQKQSQKQLPHSFNSKLLTQILSFNKKGLHKSDRKKLETKIAGSITQIVSNKV
jgi:tRNA(Met) cytidine acetyltransferase